MDTMKRKVFTFIDLFAGIGGFRIALERNGGRCVFSSEWDKNAQATYFENFGENPYVDITQEDTKAKIPQQFNVLCAGFPCQAFSIAGKQLGFDDTRGTLFFDVAEIISRRQPEVVFLENVKNLCSHDGGRTFLVIKSRLEQLGYAVFHKVMNATEYADVPQNRERIFIVAFNKAKVKNFALFEFPSQVPLTKTIHDCIDDGVTDERYFYDARMSHYCELVDGIKSGDFVYQWRRQYVRQNKSGVCPTLTANMGTGGHNVPIILSSKGIRKLTPRECLNFQGYPASFRFPAMLSDAAKYKQAGNSVVVPLIDRICRQILLVIGCDL